MKFDSLQKEREELIVKVKDLEEQVESGYQTNLELGKDCRRLCDELHEAKKERDQLKETNERMKAFLIDRIRNSYISIENGGCEAYPWDSFDTHQIEGMKRAYQDVLS